MSAVDPTQPLVNYNDQAPEEALLPDPLASDEDQPAIQEGPGNPSILSSIAGEIEEVVESADTKTLPVGKIRQLAAVYRVLGDDEIDVIKKKATERAKQAKRVRHNSEKDAQAELERHIAAVLLATACVELLYVDPETGEEKPLAEALETTGPLRYDHDTARLLNLDKSHGIGQKPTAAQVVTALHTWGRDNTSPLRANSNVIEVWSSSVNVEALEEALEGN